METSTRTLQLKFTVNVLLRTIAASDRLIVYTPPARRAISSCHEDLGVGTNHNRTHFATWQPSSTNHHHTVDRRPRVIVCTPRVISADH